MRRLIPAMTALLLCGWSGRTAHAKPEYLEVLLNTYKPYSSALSARSCTNCHVSDSDSARNSYGKQIALELEASGQKELTAAILHKVEGMGAPGATYLDAIKAGKAPGEVKIAGSSSSVSFHTATTGSEMAPEKKSWLPKNIFHPAIVHFPIALFIAGLLLDFVGLTRKNPTLLLAGWYNLVLAAVSAIAGIATGLAAALSMRLPFKGLILNHMLLAVLAAVIMWVLVALRVHRHEKMSRPIRIVYYVLAAAGLILISYSGHLGGVFVYGE